MNKAIKVVVAILGATELIFSILIPISVALLLLPFAQNQLTQIVVLLAGIFSSLYRALRLWLMNE